MRPIIIVYSLLFCLLMGCKKDKNVEFYDTDQSYVYFALLNPDRSSNKVEWYIDSMSYSFALEKDLLESKKLAIPIQIIGAEKLADRGYSFSIDENKTTIDKSLISFSQPIIKAGKLQDSLFVYVKNDPILQTGAFFLHLNMLDNDNFLVGHSYNTHLRITISDQLLEPMWWKRWTSVFGKYEREIYKLWINIYYKGVDPTPTTDPLKPVYYWDNMPFTPYYAFNPVTFIYVDKLRKYLEDNPVYPNGDMSKPRIYLP